MGRVGIVVSAMLGYRIPHARCYASFRSTGIPLRHASTRTWCVSELATFGVSTRRAASTLEGWRDERRTGEERLWERRFGVEGNAESVSDARKGPIAIDAGISPDPFISSHYQSIFSSRTTHPTQPVVSTTSVHRPRPAGRPGSESRMIQHTISTRMIGARHFAASCSARGEVVVMMDAPSSCVVSRCVGDIRKSLVSAGWIQQGLPTSTSAPNPKRYRPTGSREPRHTRRIPGITAFIGMAYLRKPGAGSSTPQQQHAAFSTSSSAQHGSHDHSGPTTTGATSSVKPAAVPDSRIANDISGGLDAGAKHTHGHSDHDHEHDHAHHSHSLFHSHAHDHSASAGELVSALSRNDRGSRITLLGLASNVLLTALKGIAGYAMNSASLIAEAGHSFSDLGADFVTLACWKVSRREPTRAYPYGYGKFETIGTLSVSLILVVAGIGIAMHSYHVSPIVGERTED
jgi:hypothetical protein